MSVQAPTTNKISHSARRALDRLSWMLVPAAPFLIVLLIWVMATGILHPSKETLPPVTDVIASIHELAVSGQLANPGSLLHLVTGLAGTLISGCLLVVLGLANLAVLVGLARLLGRARNDTIEVADIDAACRPAGPLGRIVGRATAFARKSWHLYPVGLLFGLGFDTATEIGLLALAGGAAAAQLPWYALLTLPVLFTAGMCLFDTADGVLMLHAYDWAGARPLRRVYYNLTLTGLSVAVALVVGCLELVGVLVERLDIRTGPLATLAALDLGRAGYLVVGLFAVLWLGAAAISRAAQPGQQVG